MTTRLITIQNTWRTIYYVGSALIGTLLVVVFFTFPETCYIRNITSSSTGSEAGFPDEKTGASVEFVENGASPSIPKRKTYLQELKFSGKTYTNESLLHLFLRPIALVVLPAVLWGSLVMSVTIGFLVAVSSNVAPAYATAYGFEAWQTGLCFIAAIIGSLIGIFAGGHLSDRVTDWFTKRAEGLREPEMRLPAIAISLVTTPLGLILFGVGIQNKLHWICPTVGLGLCKTLHPQIVATGANIGSKLFDRSSYQRLARVYYRLLSTHCWRSDSHIYGVEVLLWFPSLVLHQSLDRGGRLRERLWNNGCYRGCSLIACDSDVCVWQEDTARHLALVSCEVCSLG